MVSQAACAFLLHGFRHSTCYGLWGHRCDNEESSINHPLAGMGTFTAKRFGRAFIIMYYFGSLVYGNLSHRQHTKKTYGKDIMEVTREPFNKWTNKVP